MLFCDHGLFSTSSFLTCRDKSLVCTVVMLMAATLLLTVKKVTYVVIYHGEQFGLVKICTVTVSY